MSQANTLHHFLYVHSCGESRLRRFNFNNYDILSIYDEISAVPCVQLAFFLFVCYHY